MSIYRVFLLSFITSSWLFLSGFDNLVEKDVLVLERQKATINSKSYEIKQPQGIKKINLSESTEKSKHQKIKVDSKIKKPISDNTIEKNEIEKILDLSIPFRSTGSTDLLFDQQQGEKNKSANYFDTKAKKESRHIELDGDFLMTPEPQGEKLKSVDGAGLIINLKP